jgi:hypothetical protein
VTPYVILFAYGTVWILSAVPFARASLDWDGGEDIDDEDRLGALVIGILMALCWPLTLPVWGAFRLMRGTRLLRSTRELEWERRAAERDKDLELERLRRLVREHKIKGGELL